MGAMVRELQKSKRRWGSKEEGVTDGVERRVKRTRVLW